MELPFTEICGARPDEWESALRLLFEKCSPVDRRQRIRHTVAMLQKGDLDPRGVFLAKRGTELFGVMVATVTDGACGFVWPSGVAEIPGKEAIEDRLSQHALKWLRERRTKFAQAIITPPERDHARSLLRNGFTHITDLQDMRHDLTMHGDEPSDTLKYRSFAISVRTLFLETLQQTYEEADDCPEINGVRTIDEIIAGHQSQGKHDPSRWWLALRNSLPVGVLLLTELSEAPVWDLTYLGVVPESRRKGIGRELVCKAIDTVRRSGGLQLTLAVDARNRTAIHLYQKMGFEAVDLRHVYLAVWSRDRQD